MTGELTVRPSVDIDRCAARYSIPSPFDHRGSIYRLDTTNHRRPPSAPGDVRPSRQQGHFARVLTRENDRSTLNP